MLRGFTLAELAIVLLIVGLLLTGLLTPLSTQVDIRRATETQKNLEDIREALLGFAIRYGRLPCPASATSNGVESPLGGGACTNAYNGFVPAVTLGTSPVDSNGYALDSWNNRLRYGVTTANGNAFTTTGQVRANWSAGTLTPDLVVCASATGITAISCGAISNKLVDTAPAIIYSLGSNGATGGTGLDESANPNPNSADNDRVFVYHQRAAATAPNGEYDDLLIWLSPGILYSKMVAAGQLP